MPIPGEGSRGRWRPRRAAEVGRQEKIKGGEVLARKKNGGVEKRFGAAAVVMLSLMAVACDSDSSGPEIQDTLTEDQLEFVPRKSTAPPLVTLDTSFWAVRGEQRTLEIRFAGQGGTGTGTRFLEFEVEDESLSRRPDGTSFVLGDSIEISVSIDPQLYLIDFGPSGLEFNPQEPAELEIEYDEAEDDFLEREAEFDVWRQEGTGQPWQRQASVQFEELDEIEVSIFGFTRFALAVGR